MHLFKNYMRFFACPCLRCVWFWCLPLLYVGYQEKRTRV